MIAAALAAFMPLANLPAVHAEEEDPFLYGTLTEISTVDTTAVLKDSFYYSDDWFTQKPEERNDALALLSMQLTAAAVNDDADGYGTAFLKELGFRDIGYASFGSDDPEDCAYTYAKKTLKDGTELTVVCVQSYAFDAKTKTKGWTQNFIVNDETAEGEHKGFGTAADKVIDAVAALGGDKVWITGQSRGGAIADLIAAKLKEKTAADIYAYTFEAPAVTDAVEDPSAYSYIHNYLCSDDLVTRVPMWNMLRYGNVYKLNTEETNAGIKEELQKLQSVAAETEPTDNTEAVTKLVNDLESRVPERADYSRVRTDQFTDEEGNAEKIVYSYQETLAGLFGFIFGGEMEGFEASALMDNILEMQPQLQSLIDAVKLEEAGKEEEAMPKYWTAANGLRTMIGNMTKAGTISLPAEGFYTLLRLAGPIAVDTSYEESGEAFLDLLGYLSPLLMTAADVSSYTYSHHFDTVIARLKVLAPQPAIGDIDIVIEAPKADDAKEKAEQEVSAFITSLNKEWLSAEASWETEDSTLEEGCVYYLNVTLKAVGHLAAEDMKLTVNGTEPMSTPEVTCEDAVTVVRAKWEFTVGTPKQLTVSFDSGEHGETPEPVSFTKGTRLEYEEAPDLGTVTEEGVAYKFAGWKTEDGTGWNDVVLKEDILMKASWKRIVDSIHVIFPLPAVGETIQEPVFEEDDLLYVNYWYVSDEDWNDVEAIEKEGRYSLCVTAALKDPEKTEFALEKDEYDLLSYIGKAYINGGEAETAEYDDGENYVRIEYEFTAAEVQPEYTAEEGNGETWTKGSEEGMRFIFKCNIHDEDTFTKFKGITIDGTAVEETMYDKEAGSLILTLKPESLETLDAGEHTLEAEFEDGTGIASFNITEAEKEPEPSSEPEPSADPEPTAEPAVEPEPTAEPTPVPEPTPSSEPDKGAPKTGDDSNPVLWFSLLGGSLAVVLLVLILLKRNRKE